MGVVEPKTVELKTTDSHELLGEQIRRRPFLDAGTKRAQDYLLPHGRGVPAFFLFTFRPRGRRTILEGVDIEAACG